MGLGTRKRPLEGAESLRMLPLCAWRRPVVSPGAGRLLTPEALELLLEGLPSSVC